MTSDRMHTFPHIKIQIFVVVFSIFVSGCSRNNCRIYYCERDSMDKENKKVQLKLFDDSLVVFSIYRRSYITTPCFTGKYYVNYDEMYFKAHAVSRKVIELEPYYIDKRAVPIVVKSGRIKAKGEGCTVEIKGLSSIMNWALLSSEDTIEVKNGDIVLLHKNNIPYKLRGIIINDSIDCYNDTLFTKEFFLINNRKNIILLDDRFSGMPFCWMYSEYLYSLSFDRILFYSRDIIQLERREHVFERCRREKLKLDDVIREKKKVKKNSP